MAVTWNHGIVGTNRGTDKKKLCLFAPLNPALTQGERGETGVTIDASYKYYIIDTKYNDFI
jgi:hypothetical protein